MRLPDEEATRTVARSVDGRRMKVRQSAVGMVRGDHVNVGQGFVGAVMARGDVSLAQGGTRAAIAGGDLRVRQGGGGMFLAGGNAEIHQGGAGTLVTLGDVRIEQGGAVLSLAGRLDAGAGSWIGVALTPRLQAADGARVLVGPAQAALAGAAFGAVVAAGIVLARVVRGRR